jgi:carbamoyl-phosphate synthase large subunit
LEAAGVPVAVVVEKLSVPEEAPANRPTGGPDAVELIRSGKVQLVVNTPRGRGPRADGAYIRQAARQFKVPLVTTTAAAKAAAAGVEERAKRPFAVRALQEYHERVRPS